MDVKQYHFGAVPEGLYSAPADDSTLLVQYATSLSESLQPDIIQETIKLLLEEQSLPANRAASILACDPKKRFHFVCGGCGNLASIRASGCNSRLCIHCNKRKRNRLYNRMMRVFETFVCLRFLTIGWKNIGFDELTPAYFRRIAKAFERVRQRLKRHGYELGTYVCVLEIKFHHAGEPKIDSSTGQQIGVYARDEWNVHYHILFDGDFIPQKEIKEALVSVTDNETSYAYIKAMKDGDRVYSQRKALSYTVKYLGKVDGHNGDPRVLSQFYRGTENVRFYNVGIKKANRKKKEKLKLTCTHCDSQHWITPFMEPKYWDALVAGKVPDEEGVCLKPPHLIPVIEVKVDESVVITFENIEEVNALRYSRPSLLVFLSTPQTVAAICGQFSITEDALRSELEMLAERGDVMELRHDLWIRP